MSEAEQARRSDRAEHREDPGGEPGTGRRVRSSTWRRWLGLAIGILVVSGALVAVFHDREGDDGGDGGEDDRRRAAAAAAAEPTEASHEWPSSYAGPVWITVDAGDTTPRTIVIRWGPWERRIIHESADPVTYEFAKSPDDVGEPTVPTAVRVEPGAEVTFGSGATPPADAVDVNAGWTRVDDAS